MLSLHKCHISFSPSGRSVDILPGTSLLEAAWMAGIKVASACGGNGKCLKCRIIISEGEASPLNALELKALKNEDLRKGYRLACCTYALSDLKVKVPEKSLAGDVKLQLYGLTESRAVDPLIESCDIQVKAPTLEDPSADMDRVMDESKKHMKSEDLYADIGSARQLSSFLRSNNWSITAYFRSNELIGFAHQGSPPLGVAIDLGTTKIAAWLINLFTGRELAVLGELNPQMQYGGDVMTRLRYAVNNSGLSGKSSGRLTEAVRVIIREMISRLVEKAGESLAQVADLCIVGNTAMIHLLLDLPVGQLTASPYVASMSLAIDIKARDLDLISSPGAYVHILPGIGGFVGADHVAMVLGTGIDRADKITLGLDIGTNTEIVIRRPDRELMISTSCASGPAFEGAHVTDGMRAVTGAIETVRLSEKDVECGIIGDAPAIGLCGSGIIDAVAELFNWGLINERGRFKKTDNRVSVGEQGLEFEVVEGKEGEGRVVITQKDIDQIQLAKGAIRAGIAALMEKTETSQETVKEVILAGAFGSYINIANAVDMGLLPFFPNARYKQVGNAAGQGAKMALLSKEERRRAQQIAARIEYLELTTHPGFKRLFAKGMMFPKKTED
jgi:uncharacterized 2Fe-2S/4Fe-4S cluster protein (DUF4445 family)